MSWFGGSGGDGERRAWLVKESATWVVRGAVTPAERERILALYGGEGEPEGDRLVSAVTAIGAILVGLGVILFFAANWDAFGKWAKFALVVGALLGVEYGGFELSVRTRRMPATGTALVEAGALFYGAAIWLVAQAFNLSEHYPNGFLAWWVGVVPLALAARSELVGATAVVVGMAWNLTELTASHHAPLLAFVIVPAAWWLALEFRSRACLLLAFLHTLVWYPSLHRLRESSFDWPGVFLLEIACLGAASALLATDERARARLGPLAPTLRHAGLAVALLALAPGTFRGFWDSRFATLSLTHAFDALLGLLPVALLAAACHLVRRPGEATVETRVLLGACLGAVVPALLIAPAAGREAAVLCSLLQSAAFLAVAGFLLYDGERTGEAWQFRLGLAAIGGFIFFRYIDWFFELMSKSLAFLVGGLLLLAIGIHFERASRRVTARTPDFPDRSRPAPPRPPEPAPPAPPVPDPPAAPAAPPPSPPPLPEAPPAPPAASGPAPPAPSASPLDI